MPNDDKLLTSHQAANLVQVDPSSVVKWINDGKLSAFKTPGGHRRIRQRDLVNFLVAHRMFVPETLRSRRLLLVDDDESVLKALTRSFKSYAEQLEVHTSANPMEALVMIGSVKPDALVIDAQIQGMDALALCRMLKGSPATAKIELYLATSKATPDVQAKAKAAGAVAVLPKPVTARALAELLLTHGK
jgi:excisionase family DNA binding protein